MIPTGLSLVPYPRLNPIWMLVPASKLLGIYWELFDPFLLSLFFHALLFILESKH